ncbi:hypothetical protein CUJ86_03605 [Methanofollis fontis]|uniref:Uncharacterized protein n=1 Tax=Methanofollis fontis TaxID=2052832 RepID=A0A483CRP8_9EURY|nr:hypothetical protein CUJ86_03605 [Methanofollis fontis]
MYSSDSAEVPLTYDSDPMQAPPAKLLSTGWNAIGCTGSEDIKASAGLISIRNCWSHLIGFDAAGQTYETAIFNDEGDGTIHPTRGYWVFMTEDGTLAATSA